MKINMLTLIILLFFSINFSFADDWGDNFKIEEEAYIDDIPFDTKKIFKKYFQSKVYANICK